MSVTSVTLREIRNWYCDEISQHYAWMVRSAASPVNVSYTNGYRYQWRSQNFCLEGGGEAEANNLFIYILIRLDG